MRQQQQREQLEAPSPVSGFTPQMARAGTGQFSEEGWGMTPSAYSQYKYLGRPEWQTPMVASPYGGLEYGTPDYMIPRRDPKNGVHGGWNNDGSPSWRLGLPECHPVLSAHWILPVSYTHLTLPTIYSV